MGNSRSQEPSFVLDAKGMQDWVKVQEQGYYELWMNKKSNKQVQAYPIPQSFVRSQDQLQKYNFRKLHRQHLVIVEAIVTPGNSLFCSQPRTAYALVQNITGRLSQFKRRLSLEQALYVLSAAAQGYNTLNSFYGPLEPHSEMICFNEQGQVKIWLNENLALNEPSQAAKPSTSSNNDFNVAQLRAKDGVNKLIKIVQQASSNGFMVSFIEECKKLSTYFQTANMVSYFCYANNIELPSKILVCKNLQNPSINNQRMLIKQQSNPNLQTKVTSLDTSRVKTIVFRSSQVQEEPQLINPPVFKPLLPRNSIQFSSIPQSPQKTVQSPKITFNIRSTLPAPLSQQKVQGVLFGKPIFKTVIPNPNPHFPSFPNLVRSTHESPKVQKQPQEINKTKQVGQNFPSPQKPFKTLQTSAKDAISTIVQNKKEPIQQQKNAELHRKQALNNALKAINEYRIESPIASTQPTQPKLEQLALKDVKDGVITNEQKNQAQSHQKSVKFSEHLEDHNQEYEQQQEAHQNKIIEGSYFGTHQQQPSHVQQPICQVIQQNQEIQQYNQPQRHKILSKPSAIDDLKEFMHDQETNNYNAELNRQESYNNRYLGQRQDYDSGYLEKYQVEHKPKQQQNIISKHEVKNSAYSSMERYSSPSNHYCYQNSPIMQQLEENLSSPPKDNTQIQEWQARLTKFTQSRHSQQNDQPKTFEIEKFHVAQSKRQVVYKQEESVNELANLDQFEIQEYIRKKYNLYTTQSSSSKTTQKPKLAHQRTSLRQEPQRASQFYENLYHSQQRIPYKSYKSTRFDEINELLRPREYNKEFYEKQNYYPSLPNYTYQSSNRAVELSQPQIHTNSYRPPQNAQEKYVQVETEKPKYRAGQISKIDERYNKYVLNTNRVKQSALIKSNVSRDKDVSLVLAADQSKICGFSPKAAQSQLDESIKRGQNAFGHSFNPSPIRKNEVTYEQLRTLLWEQ